MSGIVGRFSLDGSPAHATQLEPMVEAVSHRGPDGTSVWTEGALGLGHVAHHTTPEAHSETWPLIDRDRQVVLVADARIDNRAELIQRLDPQPTADGVVTDAILIRAAYERWGTECPLHLIGAFAFALWDGADRRLFCVRNALGTRPFFYTYDSGRSFAFGSEIKALFPVPFVSRSIEEESVADYLMGVASDVRSTFYRDIQRLPRGHALEVSADGLRTWQYWALDPDRELQLGSDEAYSSAFLERFEEAVRCRLRSDGSVGAYLSGGLDSSSIAVTASDLLQREGEGPLPTFSTLYDQYSECDEREYIQAVLDEGGFDPHFYFGDDVNPVENLDDLLAVHDQPFFAPNLATRWSELPDIRTNGPRILLGGHGGDEVVSEGVGRLDDLARAGKWLALARETWGMSGIRQEGMGLRLWGQYAWQYGIQPWLEARPWAQRIHGWMHQLRNWIPGGASRQRPQYDIPRSSLVGARLRERVDIDAKSRRAKEEYTDRERTTRHLHYADLADPMQGVALEVLDRTMQAHGMELRLPFLDRRLVEFCLALPADQKRRHGWGRYVLRRAMRSRLPDDIRLRKSKTDFTRHVAVGLSRKKMMPNASNHDRSTAENDYLRQTAVEDLVIALEDHGPETPAQVIFPLWRCVVLRTWDALRKRSQHGEQVLSRSHS